MALQPAGHSNCWTISAFGLYTAICQSHLRSTSHIACFDSSGACHLRVSFCCSIKAPYGSHTSEESPHLRRISHDVDILHGPLQISSRRYTPNATVSEISRFHVSKSCESQECDRLCEATVSLLMPVITVQPRPLCGPSLSFWRKTAPWNCERVTFVRQSTPRWPSKLLPTSKRAVQADFRHLSCDTTITRSRCWYVAEY